MKKALITGISGQDGSYLAELLLKEGVEVHGIIRRTSSVTNAKERIEHILDKIHLRYGDMSDFISLWRAVEDIKPDYVFNLAAISQVKISFDVPQYTMDVNANAVQVILDACVKHCPDVRFYQASSSEMFGISIDEDNYQRETTTLNPASPYGVSKVTAYNLVRHYRRAYNLHANNGILFNHESPRRGANFVTQKVARAVAEIKLGLINKIELGNLDACRDWGHAKDFVKAMWLIVNHPEPTDLVISTGETHSVRDMCDLMFSHVGLDYKNYVISTEKYKRPEEVPYLKGDCSLAKKTLGWKHEYSFETLMIEMVDYWIERLS